MRYLATWTIVFAAKIPLSDQRRGTGLPIRQSEAPEPECGEPVSWGGALLARSTDRAKLVFHPVIVVNNVLFSSSTRVIVLFTVYS